LMALVVLSLATVPGARAAARGFKARTLGLLTLVCLLVAAPATAQVNYAVSGSTAYVASSPNASGAIVIASTYNGYPVTSIGDYAFSGYSYRGCTNLTSVTIPNSVTNFGIFAFYNCNHLTNVTIPDSVTTIRDQAFKGCTSLTSMTIPNSVTDIRGEAFEGCSSLSNLIIGNSVTAIGFYVFLGCTSLTNVTIPNSVTAIGYAA